MAVFLKGLALANYRGIGPELQSLSGFEQFNFLVGANNSGKSAVLNFISRHIPMKAGIKLDDTERYRGPNAGSLVAALALDLDPFFAAALAAMPNEHSRNNLSGTLRRLCEAMTSTDGMIWLTPSTANANSWEFLHSKDPRIFMDAITTQSWGQLWHAYNPQITGGSLDHWIPEAVGRILRAQDVQIPETALIPAIRSVGRKSEPFSDYSGKGLIDQLAALQNPSYDKRADSILFNRINNFLKNVTDDNSATIEIPHDREHILVHMGNMVLPLESLGTGIHEVIMIASFCTISNKMIVCIEEPELHLHPLLQRKLLRYLSSNTTNQYFIASHSGVFLDSARASVFHVWHERGQTRVSSAHLRADMHKICADLGHRASDLLQSNCIIWVEGPSDRIYLNHWIRDRDATLIEGIHYSIMFYGGRLLSHLSADDETVQEFIDLKALNQNMAIILDSDRNSARSPINATKKRIAEEISKGRGVSWITRGREIENYVAPEMLHDAIKTVYETVYDSSLETGPYDHALYFKRKVAKKRRTKKPSKADALIETQVDKVAVARAVCLKPAELKVLDLRERISEIVTLIHNANS